MKITTLCFSSSKQCSAIQLLSLHAQRYQQQKQRWIIPIYALKKKLGWELSPLFTFPFPPGSIWPWDRFSCPHPAGTRPCLGRTHSCPFPSLPLSPQCVFHHSCTTGDSSAHLPVPSFRSLRLSYQDNKDWWEDSTCIELCRSNLSARPHCKRSSIQQLDRGLWHKGEPARIQCQTLSSHPGYRSSLDCNAAIFFWKLLGAKFKLKLNRSEFYPALEVSQRPGWAATPALPELLRIFQRLNG